MKFMLPRIQMIRQMLKSSGMLAICIDYRELFNLGKMCDEVFGEENRIAIISWQKATVNSMVKHVSVCTEYVLVYAKNKESVKTNLLPREFDDYDNIDNDPLGSWVVGDPTAKDLTPNNKNIYAIQNPFTGALMYPRKDETSQGRD
jgi:adenine-specific DNA-methyltransferase